MRTIGTLALLCLAGGYAAAQQPADSDGDGAVSRQEFLAAQAERAERRFARLDADGDGMLTESELREGGPGHARGEFGRVDTDGDGLLDAGERPGRRFGGRGPRY